MRGNLLNWRKLSCTARRQVCPEFCAIGMRSLRLAKTITCTRTGRHDVEGNFLLR